jgi:thioredoxin 1
LLAFEYHYQELYKIINRLLYRIEANSMSKFSQYLPIVAIILLVAFVLARGINSGSGKATGGRAVKVAEFGEGLTDDDMVLVKFGAPWCGPCRMVEKELDSLDAEKLGVKIVKIDTDENQQLARANNVNGIPHLMLVRNGKTLSEVTGFLDSKELESWIAENR